MSLATVEASLVTIEAGTVIGLGGTNARVGICDQGDIVGFTSEETPDQPAEFFKWLARQALTAADKGSSWLVAGFPGPVTADGRMIGPMANVKGLANDQYDLAAELTDIDPAVGRLLYDDKFTLLPVNDGELAAHAAADRIGNFRYARTAAFIIGTGVGVGIVDLDPNFQNVCRANRSNPGEYGHIPDSVDPFNTIENSISGPALERIYGKDARELPAGHPAWKNVGETAGRVAIMLGLADGVNLFVPTGGVGVGASDKYKDYLSGVIETFRIHGNATQKAFIPKKVATVPPAEAQIFELFGAEGVMRDARTQVADNFDSLVLA